MKYVEVKKDIQVTVNGEAWKESDGTEMKPWSFAQYLDNIVLPDPAMGTGYKSLKACAIIEAQFKDARPGTWVGVEDAHWELLKNTIENPKGGGIHAGVLRQFIPFMDAVIGATSEKPTSGKNNAQAKTG